jgi:hypothetical protein
MFTTGSPPVSSDFIVKLTYHSLPLNAVVKNAWSLVFLEV